MHFCFCGMATAQLLKRLSFRDVKGLQIPASSIDLFYSENTKRAGTSTVRKFLKKYVPIIKYHNPNISINQTVISKDQETTISPSISVSMNDGSVKKFDVPSMLKEFAEKNKSHSAAPLTDAALNSNSPNSNSNLVSSKIRPNIDESIFRSLTNSSFSVDEKKRRKVVKKVKKESDVKPEETSQKK
jgi:Mitochondrial ribosomal protein L51 / S25 / CI-B8 domain